MVKDKDPHQFLTNTITIAIAIASRFPSGAEVALSWFGEICSHPMEDEEGPKGVHYSLRLRAVLLGLTRFNESEHVDYIMMGITYGLLYVRIEHV